MLEIERETIKFYEYFGKYSIDEAEFFGGIFVFLLQILAKFFNIYSSRHIRRKSIFADRIELNISVLISSNVNEKHFILALSSPLSCMVVWSGTAVISIVIKDF